jgi:hypothetical protein
VAESFNQNPDPAIQWYWYPDSGLALTFCLSSLDLSDNYWDKFLITHEFIALSFQLLLLESTEDNLSFK